MVSTLQVHILAGPQAGARLQLNQSPVGFGRAAENALVIDVDVVSRQHGQLIFDPETNAWQLQNLSQNGTRVGRKKATKKPVPLTDGAAITIGDIEVFRVYLTPPAEAAAAGASPAANDAPAKPDRAPGTGAKGRSKLWIGLGVWFALCLAAMVFFATLDTGQDNKNAGPQFYIPGNEIPDMQGPQAGIASVRRLLAEPLPSQDPDASRFNGHLSEARAAANAGTRSLYQAYRHYQQAMAYSQNPTQPIESLSSIDKIEYTDVLDRLATIIYEKYIEAYRRYEQGDYSRARALLDELRQDFYPGNHRGDDPLAQHIRELRNAAHAQAR